MNKEDSTYERSIGDRVDRVKEELEVKIFLRVSSQERTMCWEFLLDQGSNMTCGVSFKFISLELEVRVLTLWTSEVGSNSLCQLCINY